MKGWRFVAVALAVLVGAASAVSGAESLDARDRKVMEIARECRDKVKAEMVGLVQGGTLTQAQLFDTFYIPIAGTEPQKYHTQYDRHLDGVIQTVLDDCLASDEGLVFVVAVDKNGYLPTHNTKYSQPLTGNSSIDMGRNRTKRIFNDRTGLAAARNTDDYLLQRYSRDTGEMMADLSVPIFLGERHWGALRIGYRSR